MPDLKDRFRRWALDPGNHKLDMSPFESTGESAEAMIEEAMWMAYSEGYKTCQADIRSAFERLVDSAGKSGI
ncbi:hypothetical protein BH10PSE18_BH10PSE18_18990 [soil metagenome]